MCASLQRGWWAQIVSRLSCWKGTTPPSGQQTREGQPTGCLAALGRSWTEAEGGCSLSECSCSSERWEPDGRGCRSASHGFTWPGPKCGHRGLRLPMLQGCGPLCTDLFVMKFSPEDRLRGDWLAQPP